MRSTIGIVTAVALSLSAAHGQTPAPGFADGVCTESPHVSDRPSDDPGASSLASPGATWFANDSRTLWAWWWGKTYTGDYKVLWVRPGRSLQVTGTRLDGGKLAVSTDAGVIVAPVVTGEAVDGVVWLPTNAHDCAVRATLGVTAGAVVGVTSSDAPPVIVADPDAAAGGGA